MNNSNHLSDMDMMLQKSHCHFAPSPAQVDGNHYHPNATSRAAISEQQLHWSSREPPPVFGATRSHDAIHSSATSMHQQPILQLELSRSAPTSITASRTPTSMQPLQLIRWAQRPKFATSFWEEEGTLCYQVDANSVCVARRQDNDMINGTKLLNVTGMSRGKRDGILKNEKARVVVKVGPMHLKGVWITFSRAKELSHQFKISDLLHPLFLDDPNVYFQNMQNQDPPLQFVPPNQTDIPKEQTHEFERYAEYKDVPSFEVNAFSQTTPAIETSESFPAQPQLNRSATTLATTTPMSNIASSGFITPSPASSSRRTSPVSHHVYPSYDDSSSSASKGHAMLHQVPVNHFLSQKSCDHHRLVGFQGSPKSIVPGSAVPVTQTLKNYEFQSAATQFQRFNANEMLLSAAPVPQQQQQHHRHEEQQQQHYYCPSHSVQQQYYCSSHSVQQQPFIPYSVPSEKVPSSFLYTPPSSVNNSTPPTPTDPSATFQFEPNPLHRRRNVSQHTQNDTFVLNSYQQQQHQQVNGFNLFDF